MRPLRRRLVRFLHPPIQDLAFLSLSPASQIFFRDGQKACACKRACVSGDLFKLRPVPGEERRLARVGHPDLYGAKTAGTKRFAMAAYAFFGGSPFLVRVALCRSGCRSHNLIVTCNAPSVEQRLPRKPRQKTRCGESEDSQLEAVFGFDAVVCCTLPKTVLRRPWRGVSAPTGGIVFEDERGARKVAR